MALEASHIRFALEVANKYQVADEKKYIAGAIYPDSRYVTGIERHLTHPQDFLSWDISQISDFKKGWHTHLLYDKIQTEIIYERFSDLLESDPALHTNNTWVIYTALKILQDLEDAKYVSDRDISTLGEYVENPLGENLEVLAKFYAVQKQVYANHESLKPQSYMPLWELIKVGEDRSAKIVSTVEGFARDPKIVESVHGMYAESIEKMKQYES